MIGSGESASFLRENLVNLRQGNSGKVRCILVNNAVIASTSLQSGSKTAAEMRRNMFEDEKSTLLHSGCVPADATG